MKGLLSLVFFISLSAAAYPTKPDLNFTFPSFCTDRNPDFREFRYVNKVAICSRSVSTELKSKIYDDYKIPLAERVNYTIDHLIPLSLGGSNGRENLWPQHKSINTAEVERRVYEDLSRGRISYQEALNTILNLKLKTKDRR